MLYFNSNLLNRRNVKISCKDAIDPCEDFLEMVVTAYILEAVMDILGMSTTEDIHVENYFNKIPF